MLFKLRDTLEQEVRHDLHVWTHPSEHHRKHRSVEHSVGVIGHDHDGTFSGNPIHVSSVNLQVNIHLAQKILEDEAVRGAPHALVQLVSLLERQQFFRKSWQTSQVRRIRQHTRVANLILAWRHNWHGVIGSAPTLHTDEGQMKCW
jgi:hypothetical protein